LRHTFFLRKIHATKSYVQEKQVPKVQIFLSKNINMNKREVWIVKWGCW